MSGTGWKDRVRADTGYRIWCQSYVCHLPVVHRDHSVTKSLSGGQCPGVSNGHPPPHETIGHRSQSRVKHRQQSPVKPHWDDRDRSPHGHMPLLTQLRRFACADHWELHSRRARKNTLPQEFKQKQHGSLSRDTINCGARH